MNCEQTLEYTQNNFPSEHDLIGQSLMNFYSLRLKSNKSEVEELHQEMILEGVIELFRILSEQISLDVNVDYELVFKNLNEIYIKS